MNKLFLSCLLFILGCTLSFSQTEQRVTNVGQLQTIGYTLGAPVYIGQINGVNVYRANYATDGKCKGKRLWCRQCAGCCSSGSVDFDSNDNVLKVNVNNIDGQLYYYTETNEDWFLSNGAQ